MLESAKDWLLQQGYSKVIPKELKCRSCGTGIHRPADIGATGLDAVVSCPRCGWSGTIDLLLRSDPDEPEVVAEQPRDSKIELRVEPNLTRTWIFPASKKFNFLVLFAILWIGFIGLFTALMIGSGEENFEDVSKPGGLLFLVPFWLVGIFLFISSLWMMFASQELTVKPDGRILSVRHFLGIKFRRRLEANRKTSIGRAVVYTQNDSPVYTVEISDGKKNRIRLSSTMSNPEKAWMISQLRSALNIDEPATEVENSGYASAQRLGSPNDLKETRSDVLTIRRTDSKSFEILLGFRFSFVYVVVAIFFLATAIFLGWQSFEGFRSLDDSSFEVFDSIFIVMPGLMALGFGIAALAALFIGSGMKKRKRTLKFYESQVVADPEWPFGAPGGTFNKGQFERVDRSRVGHSNGDPRYSVKLLGQNVALPICRFRNGEEAGLMEDWAREWLG